ncbi:hypothetical protein R3P38DRAFT_3019567 [Favolaschia claudopus]|uniref:Uncharacterized protein n=1 Tax=Favolaschia claudopus TaxID=2862362 RepID=A0AAW0AHN4_9AGAR
MVSSLPPASGLSMLPPTAPPPGSSTHLNLTTTRRRKPQGNNWELTPTNASQALDPAFGPDFTFSDILTLRLPAVRDVSQSDHTTPYSNRYPSPTPPRFYLRDDGLVPALIDMFQSMLDQKCRVHNRRLGDCNTPPDARVAWDFLKNHVDSTQYTNEGFVAATCATSASIQEFSQCGDQMIIRAIRQERPNLSPINWPISGVGVEWKTSRVFQHHRHELGDFSVIGEAGAESMEGIMKKMGLHMNTVENHMRSEVDRIQSSTGLVYPGPATYRPTNRFGAIFTGSNLVMLEAITGVLGNEETVPGLAYTVVSVAAPPSPLGDPSFSIIALLLAALYDGGPRSTIDDLGEAARNIWSQYQWLLEQRPQPSPGDQSNLHPTGSSASYGKGDGSKFQYSGTQQYQLVDLKYDIEGFDTPARPLFCYSEDSCFGRIPCGHCVDEENRIVLELDPKGARTGSRAAGFRGKVHRRDHKDIDIFLKTYSRRLVAFLERELMAYIRLKELTCVPRVLAVIAEPFGGYAGLVLEDAGIQLGSGDWDDVELSTEDR